MTNEEIRKRFLFELEMGMFKKFYGTKGRNGILFEAYNFKIEYILDFLKYCGFKTNFTSYQLSRFYADEQILALDPNEKTVLFVFYRPILNSFPDYVKGYKKDDK